MLRKSLPGSLVSILSLAIFASECLHAVDGTWVVGGTGRWSDPNNWVDGIVASGKGAKAYIGFGAQNPKIVTIDNDAGTLWLGELYVTNNGSPAFNITADAGRWLYMDNNEQEALISVSSVGVQSQFNASVYVTANGLRVVNLANQVSFNGEFQSREEDGVQELVFVNESSAGQNLSVPGKISDGSRGGVLRVVVDSPKTVSITGTNSFTGGLHLRNGSAWVAPWSTGAGEIRLGETGVTPTTALRLDASRTGTYSNNIYIDAPATIGISTSYATSSPEGDVLFNGDWELNANTIIATRQHASIYVVGNLSGTGNLTLQGDSSRVVGLTGSNNIGNVTITSPGRFGIGSEYALGTGTLTLGAGSGTITLERLSPSSPVNIEVPGISTEEVLTMHNTRYVFNNFYFNGTGGVVSTGTGDIYLQAVTVNITVNSSTLKLDGVVTGSISNRGINVQGPGVLQLNALNDYGGVTRITGGNLQVRTLADGGAASSIGSSSASASNLVFSGGKLDYIGEGSTTNRLFTLDGTGGRIENNGTGALAFTNTGNIATGASAGDRTLALGGSNADENVIASVFEDPASGKTHLLKDGAGRWILTGQHTHTGNTVVEDGTLEIRENGSINSSAVIINGGRFLHNSSQALFAAVSLAGSEGRRAYLGGNGRIESSVSLGSIHSVLSPGNSPGKQTYGVSQTWSAFTYLWEINDFLGEDAGVNFDQIEIEGTLTLGGTYVLEIHSLGLDNEPGTLANFANEDRSWIILTTTEGIVGFNLEDWTINADALFTEIPMTGIWSLEQDNNALRLVYHAIPEPSVGLIGLALLGVLGWRRCRACDSVRKDG